MQFQPSNMATVKPSITLLDQSSYNPTSHRATAYQMKSDTSCNMFSRKKTNTHKHTKPKEMYQQWLLFVTFAGCYVCYINRTSETTARIIQPKGPFTLAIFAAILAAIFAAISSVISLPPL